MGDYIAMVTIRYPEQEPKAYFFKVKADAIRFFEEHTYKYGDPEFLNCCTELWYLREYPAIWERKRWH